MQSSCALGATGICLSSPKLVESNLGSLNLAIRMLISVNFQVQNQKIHPSTNAKMKKRSGMMP